MKYAGFWSVIKGWLDPVVSSKVNFTKNVQDLEKIIPRERIPKELDGSEEWEYTYPEPVDGENDIMQDFKTRDSILAKRGEISDEFENITLGLIAAANAKDKETINAHREKRAELIRDLAENYWDLDPYVRAVSLYDRLGILQPGGKVDFYPKKATNGVNGTTAGVKVNGVSK